MAKLTDQTELNEAPHEDDVVHIVDVSDTTQSTQGSSFKIKVKNLVGLFIGSLDVYFNKDTNTTDDITESTSKLFLTPTERTNITDLQNDKADDADLATVAKSGNYGDLLNRPDLSAFDDVLEYANAAAFPASGETGKIYVAIDTGFTFRWGGTNYVQLTATVDVTSVAGKTGDVTLVKADVGLPNVNNTADANKPVSTAQQAALNTKAPLSHASATDNPHNVSKAQVGLALVPNVDARARASHTGTQLASTISNFAATVRATVLTGLSTASSAVVVAGDTILVAIGKLQAQVNLKANIRGSVNAQTGTTYTLVIGDEYLDGVRMTNASANTLTIPPNADVAFPVNTKILITQGGAGSTTVAAGAGVTLNAPASAPLAIGEIHGSRVCQKTATDTWLLI